MYSVAMQECQASRESLPVCLLQGNPHRLVSLREMLEVLADDYIWIGSALRCLAMEMESQQFQILPMPAEYRASVAKTLEEVAARCNPLELQVSKAATDYWRNEFNANPSRTYVEGRCAIEEIERTIRHEAASTKLFYVTRERSAEFERMLTEVRELWDKPWGIALENLDRARFCYLVDEPTASVFHSMRAAEKVLTTLARSLGIDPARDQWQTLIERTEAEIKKLDILPKGSDRERKQMVYSEMAMQMRFIKNAWRNHVMHGRAVYGEKDAREIWWHVKRTVEKACGELTEELEV
jgi:HEPN domain-containing protein